LLLSISWRREKSDASEPFSSIQRHLDEEAVSRIDDEGGAPDAAVNPPSAAGTPTLAARRFHEPSKREPRYRSGPRWL
jgi:hypothetical protein